MGKGWPGKNVAEDVVEMAHPISHILSHKQHDGIAIPTWYFQKMFPEMSHSVNCPMWFCGLLGLFLSDDFKRGLAPGTPRKNP
jgi:hypothetical protein